MKIYSTLVWNPDTTPEQDQMVADLSPFVQHPRNGGDSWIEKREITSGDGGEVNLYVIVHTPCPVRLYDSLRDAGLI